MARYWYPKIYLGKKIFSKLGPRRASRRFNTLYRNYVRHYGKNY